MPFEKRGRKKDLTRNRAFSEWPKSWLIFTAWQVSAKAFRLYIETSSIVYLQSGALADPCHVWGEETVRAYGFSFANSISFFGFQRTYFGFDFLRALPDWMQAIAATQTVVSFILLFFLGLGLRTRFRLR